MKQEPTAPQTDGPEQPRWWLFLIAAAGYSLVALTTAGALVLANIACEERTVTAREFVSALSYIFPATQFIGAVLGPAIAILIVVLAVAESRSKRTYGRLIAALFALSAAPLLLTGFIFSRLILQGGRLQLMPPLASDLGIWIISLAALGALTGIAGGLLILSRSIRADFSPRYLPVFILTWPWALRDRAARFRKKRWFKICVPLLYFHLLAWAVHFATFSSFRTFFAWFEDCCLLLIILNMCLIGMLTLLIFAFVNRFRPACILVIIPLAVLAFSHWTKVAVRGVVVYPWDLALLKEGVQVVSFSRLSGWWPNLLMLLLLAPFVVLVYGWLPAWRAKIWQRIAIVMAFALFTTSLFFEKYSALRPFHDRILSGTWNQNIAYSRAGVLLAFAAEVQYFIVPEPEGADRRTIETILADVPAHDAVPVDGFPDTHINLIMILSESFWDPTQLEHVTFSEDPIPVVRRIEEEFGSLRCVAPVFGGGTCDSELEMLTGCSMVFFPPDTAPYKYYIRKPLPSIATILRNRGYRTVSLAGSFESYFNDHQVYPRLGFDEFISAEEWTIENITVREWYIDDEATTRQIIDTAERLGREQRPYFINVNTMENHWPYPPERYAGLDYPIQDGIETDVLDERLLKMLRTFTIGMKRSDEALGTLISYFQKVDAPTMIVFYGDHLPGLGMGGNYDEIFRQCGFFPEHVEDTAARKKFLLRKYSTKAYFWNNFGYRLELPENPVSMNYFPAVLLPNLGITPPPFFLFTDHCRRRYPVITPNGCLDSTGTPLCPRCDDGHRRKKLLRNRTLFRHYELLQWDRVFGDGISVTAAECP